MASKRIRIRSEPNRVESEFLSRFHSALVESNPAIGTSRIWFSNQLSKLVGRVKASMSADGIKLNRSQRELVEWIHRIGLARSLPTDGEPLSLIDIGPAGNETIDPLEILMAFVPNGVICYGSAVGFHGLTTQPIRRHHIARLTTSTLHEKRKTVAKTPNALSTTPAAIRYGTRLGQIGEAEYFRTDRSARLVPGVQERQYGPRTRIRMTILEQTLLDALFHPYHVGGPEIVFEAWQHAHDDGRIDDERMADLLLQMDFLPTLRRAAVMMRLIGHAPDSALRTVFEAGLSRILESGPLPLLTGMPYPTLDPEWKVLTP